MPAYLQKLGFEHDIFISYAHNDNRPLSAGEQGWVANFHYSLENRLIQLLGDKPKIWRDPKLKGHDYLSDTLKAQFPRTALLLVVLSPSYLQSEWCSRELDEFVGNAEASGGVCMHNRSRIFKIAKTRVERNEQPPELQGLIGYDFYQDDPQTGMPREFRQDVGPNKDQRYWDKFEDLAFEIHESLQDIRGPKSTVKIQSVNGGKKSVYLAETTSDMKLQRDDIKREIEQFDYVAFPDVQLPLDAEIMLDMVRSFLRKSRLSVHVVGSRYGVIPESEDEKRSIVRLQYEIAGEFCTNGDLCRLVWMPPDLQPADDDQKRFIEYLRTDERAQRGAEITQGPIEDLKTLIQEKLRNGHANGKKTAAGSPRQRRLSIYLVHDKVDQEAVKPLSRFLFAEGYDVSTPLFKGSATELRQDHEASLVDCEAVLIFYGESNQAWLRTKLRELRKALGLGREGDFAARAIYLGSPESDDKTGFEMHDVHIIRQFGEFNAADLAPFLHELAEYREGQR